MYVNETYTAFLEVMEIIREKHRAVLLTNIMDSAGEVTITGEALVSNKQKI
jgi:hypothetical protein